MEDDIRCYIMYISHLNSTHAKFTSSIFIPHFYLNGFVGYYDVIPSCL